MKRMQECDSERQRGNAKESVNESEKEIDKGNRHDSRRALRITFGPDKGACVAFLPDATCTRARLQDSPM